ncbi:MAG TPA: SCO family protein [Streptosporangiaceae bacterium]|nr:SCO family protein [Streptosporangiaceae bacterium]
MASAVVAGLAVAALAMSLVARASVSQPWGSALRPSGIPAGIPTSLANLMELSPVPASAAPEFTLTDQAGHTMSMAGLRGRVVVLEFMDPHCTDICPIVSQEFMSAYRDLGSLASRVVFAAVNVNQYHLRVADVAAFSREQRLDTIPSWHFFTGTYPALRAVWRAYGVAVHAPSRNADVIHSSLVFFIDPQGRERFLATPMVDHTMGGASFLPAGQLTSWGRGIALVARQLAG